MPSKPLIILAGACLTMCGSQVLAAVSYSFVTDATTYSLSGDSATVEVYLKETLTDGSLTQIGSSSLTSGLDGAAFKVQRDNGSSVKIVDLLFNDAFDNVDPSIRLKLVNSTTAELSESTLRDTNGVGLTGDRVYLGSIVLGSDVGIGSSDFTVLSYSNRSGNIVSRFDGIGIFLDDPTQPNSATFNVAVPEPGTIGLLATAGLLCLRRSRRQ